MVSTTAGGRPFKSVASRPGATHGGSIDLDAGAIWRSFLRGMSQGGAVAREMSSGNQVRVGQWGATSRTCSSSSLSLHSVCASRLTGGKRTLSVRPEASCVPVRQCRGGPRSGRSTAGSGRTRRRQTGLPELPRIDSRSAGSSRDGVATLRGM